MNPLKIEQTARRAALFGARILRKYYETKLKITYKGEVNLLTQADLESQQAIVQTLRRAFPDHAILAEENELGHRQSLEGPIWVIDPLDGTTNFAHGFPMFCISIAYREKNKTQFGLVYQPLLKELFIAHRGKGARLNGKKISVSNVQDLSRSLVATGFPYDHRTSAENNLNYFAHFVMAATCCRRAGAAALDLAYVAAGRIDGFWEPKLAPWDVAAGSLLVEEAGGKISDYAGGDFKDLWGKEILASNGNIHSEMMEILRLAKNRKIANPLLQPDSHSI